MFQAEFILERKAFLHRFVACAFQKATSRAMLLHELKKVQLQERFTLVTRDSIGHLKMLCISILSLAMAFESE